MDNILVDNLIDTFKKFINELELSFESISSEERLALSNVVDSLKENSDLIQKLNSTLEPFSEKICKIQFMKSKIPSRDYEFLKDINLFGVFSFEPFSKENKNTKRSIINYLYSFYIFSSASENNEKALEMIESLQENLSNININSPPPQKKKKNRHPQSTMNEVNNLVSDLMSNTEIMSIATDISKQFQENKIDPNMLMKSLIY